MRKFTLLVALLVCSIGFSQSSLSSVSPEDRPEHLQNAQTTQRLYENPTANNLGTTTNFSEYANLDITNQPVSNIGGVIINQTRNGGVSVYTDAATFNGDCGGTLVLEDFAGGTGAISNCGPVISSAGDGCFPAGEIVDGITIEASNATDTVEIPAGSLGGIPTINMAGAFNFIEYTTVNFTGPDDVFAVSFILYNNGDVDTDVRIFDTGGTILDTFTFNNPIQSENFVGFISPMAIGSIEIEGANGEGELVGNLEFGACVTAPMNIAYANNNSDAQLITYDVSGTAFTAIGGNSEGAGFFEAAAVIDPADNDFAFALQENGNMYSLELATGTYTLLGNIAPPAGEFWTSMDYDGTSTIYAMSSTYGGASTFSTIDPVGLSTTVVGAAGLAGAVGLAFDGAGTLFTYDIGTDSLYTVDPGTGATTLVGAIGFDAQFGQGLAYDADNDQMYMAAFNNTVFDGEWRSVDTTTGATTLIDTFNAGTLTQIAWALIPSTPVVTNDECAGATPVACGDTVVGTTADNTDTGGNAAPDEWYSFTGAGGPQIVTVSLCDGGTDYDSLLRIFDACGGTEIATNDDSCGLQSEITFLSDGTSTYYIMVEGFGSNSGNFSLAITCVDPPVNDECAGALPIACGETVVGDTNTASVDTSPECNTSITAPGVWYEFTDGSGLLSDYVVSLCDGGTDYDSKLTVYSGDCGTLVCVGDNDDTCGLQSEVAFQGDGSTTYYILVHGFGSATGNFSLNVSCTPVPPPNDLIVNSIDVDEIGFPYTDPAVSMPAATTEGGNPTGCNIDGANGVWYNFVPDGDGFATATVVSPAGATFVNFFSAPDENATESDLTLVDFNGNQCAPQTDAIIPTTAGQAYYVFVVNTGGVTDIVIEGQNLGTDDNKIEGFTYYPNPADGILNLNAIDSIDNVAIYNILGQQVLNQDIAATNAQLDIANLAQGAYIMKVVVNGETGTYKIIKR
ncbi:MAG: T9SS type A sorting domain-containing protein [Bacteroidota bacterium]